MVYRPGSVPRARSCLNRFLDKLLGIGDSGRERKSAGQQRRDGGRIRAPGAVRVSGLNAPALKKLNGSFAKQNVHGVAIQMAAFYQHRGRAESRNPPRGFIQVSDGVNL